MTDRLFTSLVAFSALIGVVVLLLLLAYVVREGVPALNLAFFLERPKPVGESGGGVAHAIAGTLLMLAAGSVIGITVGVGTGIFLSEFGAGRFAGGLRFAIDLLAGVPSIVVGVFVWALMVRRLIGHYSGLAGSVSLAIIMIPIIARTVDEVLKLVPSSLREASLALGVPHWKTILYVVLPTARAGIITGTILAAARAGGETAPLLLTALGNEFFSINLLQPMAALPLQIYVYARSPYHDWHVKAWGASLVLIVVIGVFSLLTRIIVKRRMKGTL